MGIPMFIEAIRLIFWVSHAVRPMKISTPRPLTIHSKVLLAQKMLITQQMMRPKSAITRKEPIFVRSRLVK